MKRTELFICIGALLAIIDVHAQDDVVCGYPNVSLIVSYDTSECPSISRCTDSMDDCHDQGCNYCSAAIRNGEVCSYTCNYNMPLIACAVSPPEESPCLPPRVQQVINTDDQVCSSRVSCMSLDDCVTSGCQFCEPYRSTGRSCNYTCKILGIIE